MESLLLLTLIIVGISVLLLSVGILIQGRFVNAEVLHGIGSVGVGFGERRSALRLHPRCRTAHGESPRGE